MDNSNIDSDNPTGNPLPAPSGPVAAAVLQRQLDGLMAVFGAVSSALLVIDERGIVVMANPEAVRLFGPLHTLLDASLTNLLIAGASDASAAPLLDAETLPFALQQRRWKADDVRLRPSGLPTFPADFVLIPFETGGRRNAVVVITDNSDREPARAQLEWQATHDPLTGLSNRAILLDRLEHALLLAARSGTWPTLIFLDLDRFKSVNDQLGHSTGDRLLVEAAERIKRSVRAADTVARIGGDEFVVLCEALERVDIASQVAARILHAMEEVFDFNGEQVRISASIGITTAGPSVTTAEDLLRNADMAMYRAKENGRNQIATFDTVMHTEVRRRIDMERALRVALDNDELSVAYQPIFNTERGALVAFEALVRWEHETFGKLSPLDFIPLAEETGLIAALGERVLDIACRDAASWREAAGYTIGLHVNVSGRQVSASNFVSFLSRVMRHHHMEPSSLTLELQESVLLDNPERAVARLVALRELGLRIAIDDFGVGYSSLAYLRRFPLDVLKVDRQFVAGIAQSPQGQQVLQAIVDLAAGLDYSVIAEGVEQADELASLCKLGFQFAQGYLLAAPMSPTEALLLAAANAVPEGGAPVAIAETGSHSQHADSTHN
ncbi:MAG: conserved hypothetical signaling protein [Ilumatobacteraceae bacterium]|nr:conserved hypothetical signaling protein [Ilumatobacteraceae bacterium]